MKLEHFAINVKDPLKMADWYVNNLGMRIVRQSPSAPYTTFLADDSGRIMIEVYANPADQVPDYRNMNPLILHFAFVSENPEADKNRLMKAGAHLINEQSLPDGSVIVMLKDPWGVSVQLCKRGNPMLLEKERDGL
ncbi:MAG TPA: VOC family protein [Cytophagales bacterium]|nr:VOC family protein [Cytophagales bacterium]